MTHIQKPAVEYRAETFEIYKEDGDPYSNDKSDGTIELAEASYIGGDLYMIPLQIFKTSHPLLLKAVVLISDLYGSGFDTYGMIRGNNIRTVELSVCGFARYDDNGRRSPETWDLRPAPNRVYENEEAGPAATEPTSNEPTTANLPPDTPDVKGGADDAES